MNLESLLQDYNIPYIIGGSHRHVRHGWLGIDCYQCSPNTQKYKLGINLYNLAISCWTCGTFKLRNVLKNVLDIPHHQANQLANKLYQNRYQTPYPETPLIIRPENVIIPRNVKDLQEAHINYLLNRGYDPEELTRLWGVKGIGIDSKLSWRIFIPITYRGETVSWTTRSLSDNVSLRYITAKPNEEKISAKQLLFGEDYCRHSVICCEGPFDAMKIGPGAVATFGVSYTIHQLKKLAKYPIRVIAFDSEPDAQRRARELMQAISIYKGETYNIQIPDAKDPSSATEDIITEIRERFLQ